MTSEVKTKALGGDAQGQVKKVLRSSDVVSAAERPQKMSADH